jgi:hypothetical protein
MVSFLFWNLGQNPKTFPVLSRLAAIHSIDVLFLAECPTELDALIAEINQERDPGYRIADMGIVTKVRAISRLPVSRFFPSFNNEHGDMTIWKLRRGGRRVRQVQVAVVHLLSKAGGTKPADQQAVAEKISEEVAEFEDKEGCQDTVLVGDLNMDPFDPGMVVVSGFHATMTKQIARLPDRKWRKHEYRRFYNPMWGLFGDRTPGPPGTHHWQSSTTSNQYWHIFDQVLLRPTLMDQLGDVQILDHDGQRRLLDEKEMATKDHLSDHLPILFSLEL